jgi:hypothetical protein
MRKKYCQISGVWPGQIHPSCASTSGKIKYRLDFHQAVLYFLNSAGRAASEMNWPLAREKAFVWRKHA